MYTAISKVPVFCSMASLILNKNQKTLKLTLKFKKSGLLTA